MRGRQETGFSLLELLIAVTLIVLLAAFVTNLSSRSYAGETVIKDAARRLRLRRAEAIRLSAGLGADAVERVGWQPRVSIDFADLSTTAALRLGSCADSSVTQPSCTASTLSASCYCLNADGNPVPADSWTYRYQGSEMRLPTGWSVARTIADLPADIPPLQNTKITTSISFETSGQVTPVSNTQPPPAKEISAEVWAIYFTDGARDARALTVNESGFIEIWRWQPRTGGGGNWQGFANRPSTEL